MRKVFLDDLPRCNGTNRGKIDWKESVGYKVKFIYDDVNGEITIIDYKRKDNKTLIDVKFNNNIESMNPNDFSKCGLAVLLEKQVRKYRFNVGEIIDTKTGKIKILKQIRMFQKGKYNVKGYEYECLIDKYVNQIREDHLSNGVGCPVCSGQIILKGYNDLWTTNPEVCHLMKYPERGYELSYGNAKLLEVFICPNCGYEKSQRIADVVKRKLSCPKCSDGVSYPNKFIYNFLDQLNEEYIFEYSPNWMGKKRYDIFLPNRNEVWEIHGLQHFEQASWTNSKRKTIKAEQENDKLKKKLAEENGLKYIMVDASCSEIEYIKNSLLNLPIINRYNLEDIDWLQCHKIACSSLVKIACDYWNNGVKNAKEISKIMMMGHSTIVKYLNRGAKLDWCDYDPQEVLKGNAKIIGKKYADKRFKNTKNIAQISKEGMFIKEWKSISDAEKELNICLGSISSVCRGRRKTAGGFKWMYLEDYNKQYININE